MHSTNEKTSNQLIGGGQLTIVKKCFSHYLCIILNKHANRNQHI